MAAVPSDVATKRSLPWLGEFLATERQAWIFVFKCMLAFYIAAWLSMLFQLEQPSTTMITVSIVMHPHSGMVLAKSFYRAIGTCAGSLVGLLLMSAFPQQRELFLTALALWVGICAGGAVLYRNFMSYGFVLAGYTAAIVALPAITNPYNVFDSAMMRVSEVMLGIIVAGLVSDMVLPERLRQVLRSAARSHYAHFIEFARGSLGGAIPRAKMEEAHLHFVRAAVQLEDLRASVIFEDPEARARSSRMQLLNLRYMAAATSFQSLHHLINRLQRNNHPRTASALIELYAPVGKALSPPAAESAAPRSLATRLEACEAELPSLASTLREGLRQDPELLLEFDSGTVLLYRFVSELRDFAALEAALRETQGRLKGSAERVDFRRANDYAAPLIGVVRTFLTMIALSVFWLWSGWPFGPSAMLLATIFSGLMATSPTPLAATANTWIGYAVGMIAAYFVVFWLLPGSDGFTMMVLTTMPLLLIGPYLTTRNATLPGIGAGYTLGYVYILALKNPMVYSPEHFFNDAIASLFGLMMCGVAFMIIPTVIGTEWLRRRQLQQLRRQVSFAATAPMEGLLYRFESTNRDLFHQIVQFTQPNSAESRSLLAWGLAVHDSGRAIIELRQDIRHADLPPPLCEAMQRAVDALARLYDAPDRQRWQEADRAVDHAITLTMQTLPQMRATCQPALAHLLQLRTALRDDESALGPYIVKATEIPHAT
ncbi:FUSC family protein [Dyella jiangningensis]|uniref:Fusaric acid resistance protein n=1 Tax=Dyella jiangningensis TaxID=1379159 RepID=A0A328P1R3_9GAMM|nr:FUSC family protein [Dyella jiangningensis]RAO74592.1 fusaric acid resistance protein [Dyella jiangningensis]